MPGNRVEISIDTETPISPRVLQCCGIFDIDFDGKQSKTWTHDLPIEDKPWRVGLIVGHSGAGKSVLARHIFGAENVKEEWDWDKDSALVDCFAENLTIKEINKALTAVGLSSVPAWIRPYSTLSNGEKFRANMARAITENNGSTPIVVDEFTSVVDRQVAKVTSNCIQKAIRRTEGSQFVAVTCHYDVEDWLQPDWVYDVTQREFRWRSVQPRPTVKIEIAKGQRQDWEIFKDYHYMSHYFNPAAQCFVAYMNGHPVGFTSYLHFPHPKTRNLKMEHRTVVLPDYQGLGLGTHLAEFVGQYLYERGYRYHRSFAHPALIHAAAQSKRWKLVNKPKRKLQAGPKAQMKKNIANPRRLAVYTFAYMPPKNRHETEKRRIRGVESGYS